MSPKEIQQKLEQLQLKYREIESTNQILSGQVNELFILYDVIRQLNSSRGSKEIFKILTEVLRKDFNVEEFAFFLYNKKSGFLSVDYSHGLPKRELKEFFYKSNERFVGKVFSTGKAIYIADVGIYKDFNYYHYESNIYGSIYYLPLQMPNQETIGVLKLRKPLPNSFSYSERTILLKLKEHITISLKKGFEYDELEMQAWFDAETGLYNQRYFEKRFEAEFRRAQRYQMPLSIIIISIESVLNTLIGKNKSYKKFVVNEVANFILSNIRNCDLCIRYSDGKFLVMLPQIAKSAAFKVLKKINTGLAVFPLILPDPDSAITIATKIGIANFPDDSIEPAMILDIANEIT
jgi:diguanylate cyclase (GGDEF)-like protein